MEGGGGQIKRQTVVTDAPSFSPSFSLPPRLPLYSPFSPLYLDIFSALTLSPCSCLSARLSPLSFSVSHFTARSILPPAAPTPPISPSLPPSPPLSASLSACPPLLYCYHGRRVPMALSLFSGPRHASSRRLQGPAWCYWCARK